MFGHVVAVLSDNGLTGYTQDTGTRGYIIGTEGASARVAIIARNGVRLSRPEPAQTFPRTMLRTVGVRA